VQSSQPCDRRAPPPCAQTIAAGARRPPCKDFRKPFAKRPANRYARAVPPSRSPLALAALCAAALVGFAANSLLCRAALGARSIDAASFTGIRLGSGALVLWLIVRLAAAPSPSISAGAGSAGVRGAGSWGSAAALFLYAAAFSFSYLRLTAATGALILFTAVQATMIAAGIRRGERPRALEWLGFAAAAGGLVALTLPGLAAPDPLGAALMAAAGVAWGRYSLRGRGAARPLAATADNFLRSLAFAAPLAAVIALDGHVTARGAGLAIASGAVASGVGYSLWYAALPRLAATRAAIIQLSVPVLAAAGAAALLGEPITPRLAGAAAAIVGGIALAIAAKQRR
jgi:drug/metabolite transporter (DMT)-like permease